MSISCQSHVNLTSKSCPHLDHWQKQGRLFCMFYVVIFDHARKTIYTCVHVKNWLILAFKISAFLRDDRDFLITREKQFIPAFMSGTGSFWRSKLVHFCAIIAIF